jgi:hypothetical protein
MTGGAKAHCSIVEALAANWTRLKLNSYRIWGER